MPIDTNYNFDPKKETIDGYNTRISNYNASKGSISSATLQQTPSIDFKSPNPVPVFNVAGLNSQLAATQQMTEPEKKANDLSTQIQDLNNQLVGQSAETSTQETLQGLPELNKARADLTSRVNTLKNEALALPLQLQQDAIGRGITAGGLQPIQTAALRNNAIQALSVSSLLEATQGNITHANDLVAKAVAQKYDPIKERIAAATANLKLIVESPAYSVADKKRAFEQMQIQNQLNAQNTQSAANDKETQELVVKIISSNKNVDATVIEAMRNAADPVEAAMIAQRAGLAFDTQSLPTSAQEYQFAVENGYTGSYTDYQNEDANRKRSIAAAGVANASGLNTKQVSIFNGIVDKYNKSPLVAANDRAAILKDVTEAVAADPTNAALQVSFIYSMIQALDTYQSAVREGEIGLLSSTQGLGDKINNLPDKIQNGTPLSKDKMAEYIAVSRLLTNSISTAANQKQKNFSAQAEVAGIGQAFNEYTTAINGEGVPNKDPLNVGAGASPDNPLGI